MVYAGRAAAPAAAEKIKERRFAMKRIMPLILALLLFAGCGTPEGEVAETPSPTPTPAESPEPGAPEETEPAETGVESVPVDFHLPDPGFEPDSYWQAEPFGDGGQALMLTRTEPSGAMQLMCIYNTYGEYRSGGRTERDLYCEGFEAENYLGGEIKVSGETGPTAEVSVSGDRLSVSYDGLDTAFAAPESFTKISEEAALELFRTMPYNNLEVGLPVDIETSRDELAALPGVEVVDDTTYLYEGMTIGVGVEFFGGDVLIGYVSGEAGTEIPDVRGVKIGSSADDVLACFPGAARLGVTPENEPFYGEDGILSALGTLTVSEDGRDCILLTDVASMLCFTLDENGLVDSVSWTKLVEPW